MCWVIKDYNGISKIDSSRYIGKASIIMVECISLREGMLATKNNNLLNSEIECEIVIDCYNKESNIFSFIFLLMDDIWKCLRP